MHKKIIALGIVFILLFGVFVSPVAATISIADDCTLAGGIWNGDAVTGTGTCSFSSDHYFPSWVCGPDSGLVDTFENEDFIGRQCIYVSGSMTEFETTPDAELDAWVGSCGVNVFSAPTDGKVIIYKPHKMTVTQPMPNLGLICAVGYIDSEGKTLDEWNSVTKLYYNLDKTAKGFFDQGILNFYVLQNGEWTICDNMEYLPNEGSSGYGRVACRSAGPTMFGLGTELEKYKPRLPKIVT